MALATHADGDRRRQVVHVARQFGGRVVGGEAIDGDGRVRRINDQFIAAAIRPHVAKRVGGRNRHIEGARCEGGGDDIIIQGPGRAIVGGGVGVATHRNANRGIAVIHRTRKGWCRVVGGQAIHGNRRRGRVDDQLVVGAIGARIAIGVGGRRHHIIGARCQGRCDGVVGQGPGCAVVGGGIGVATHLDRNRRAPIVDVTGQGRCGVIGRTVVDRDRGCRGVDGQFVVGAVGARVARAILRTNRNLKGPVGQGGERIVREGPGAIAIVGGAIALSTDDNRDGSRVVVDGARERRTVIVGGERVNGHGRCRGVDGQFIVGAIGTRVARGVRGGHRHVVRIIAQRRIDGVIGKGPGAIAIVCRREIALATHGNEDGRVGVVYGAAQRWTCIGRDPIVHGDRRRGGVDG